KWNFMKRTPPTPWTTLLSFPRKAFTMDLLFIASFLISSFKVAVRKETEQVVQDTKLIANLLETTSTMTKTYYPWRTLAEIQEDPISLSVTTGKIPSTSTGTITVLG